MTERLTQSKLIHDLTGKNSLTTGFFSERWMEENKLDVAAARLQHQRAVTEANGPKVLAELESPEDQNPGERDDAEQLERIIEADEYDDDRESREEIGQ